MYARNICKGTLTNLFSDLIPEILTILKDLIYFCETLLNYGKEEKKGSDKNGRRKINSF